MIVRPIYDLGDSLFRISEVELIPAADPLGRVRYVEVLEGDIGRLEMPSDFFLLQSGDRLTGAHVVWSGHLQDVVKGISREGALWAQPADANLRSSIMFQVGSLVAFPDRCLKRGKGLSLYGISLFRTAAHLLVHITD